MKKTYSRGFTLIELLVVIAIIGILSAVVLTSLGTARVKARVAAAQATMHAVQTAASVCSNSSIAVNVPGENNTGGGGLICTGEVAAYAALPTGWIYCNGVGTEAQGDGTGCGNDLGFYGSATSSVVIAESHNDKVVIACTESACIRKDEATVD